jgi:putative endonuclease
METTCPETFEKKNKVTFGRQGENIAARHLQGEGWTIVDQNWRNGRRAELDIIALDPDNVLVFIEVKTRRIEENDEGRVGFESVHGLKVSRIINSAAAYILERRLHEPNCRFDVIVLLYRGATGIVPEITHVKNAFHGLAWA